MSSAARALVIRVGALGDTVMTLPLLERAAAHCGAPCDVIGHPLWVRELTRGSDWIGEVHALGSTKVPAWLHPGLRRLRAWLKQRPAAPIIIAEHRELSHRLCAGLGEVITMRGRDEQLRGLHQVEQMQVLGDAAGFAAFEPAPRLTIPAGEQAAMAKQIATQIPGDGPLLCIQLGSNFTLRGRKADRASNIKWWPLERWISALRQITSAIPTLRILGLGAPAEAPLVVELMRQAPDLPMANLAGANLPELFAQLRCSTCMLSVDTGPAHVAAALGTPVVVLFGATDPRVNRPWGGHAPVRVLTSPADAPEEPGEDGWARHHTIDAITPEQVSAAVLEQLA
ncbi:MAG: glycosyltransferase family 9 protein [Planctomycetota bacterium]|jgi:ADP-heptose:LPS heptosyltransferase|nr:glycosyltransferase family 9 protein [Planctomycetota bacterium]